MTTPSDTPVSPRPRSAARSRLLFAVVTALLLVVAAVVAWSVSNGRLPFTPPSFHGTAIDSPDLAQDFTLTASTGEPLSLSDLRGKVVLMYFGYTYCPDVCPATLNELKKATAALGDRADEVQVVMVTVDPQRDTPEVLRDYLAHFDSSFIGLTGTAEEVLAAASPLGIYISAHEGTPTSGYLVDHTSSVLVIDKAGYLRLLHGFDTPGKDIAADVRHLLRES